MILSVEVERRQKLLQILRSKSRNASPSKEATTMIKKVPPFITKQFAGGVREFRATHRRLIKAAYAATFEASGGCAYSGAEKP